MLKSSLCDYSDAYILVKGTIKFIGVGDDDAARQEDEINNCVVFKICASFTNCISEINDVVMMMYNLIEYSNNYLKT